MTTTQEAEGILETLRRLIDEHFAREDAVLRPEELLIAPLASALCAVLMDQVSSVRSYLGMAGDALDRCQKARAREDVGRRVLRIVLEKLVEQHSDVVALVLQPELNPRPVGEGWRIGPSLHQGRHLWVLGGALNMSEVEVLERLLLEGFCRGETLRVGTTMEERDG